MARRPVRSSPRSTISQLPLVPGSTTYRGVVCVIPSLPPPRARPAPISFYTGTPQRPQDGHAAPTPGAPGGVGAGG